MSSERDLVWIVEDCWRTVRKEIEGIELAAPVYPDPLWTVRDVLLHCAFWNDEATRAIEAHLNGGSYLTDTGAESFGAGLDAMNGRVVEASRSLPDDQVWPHWIAAQDTFTDAVRSLDKEAMAREITCPWDERSSVTEMVQAELGHEQDHINDVITAIAGSETAE